MEIHRNAHMLKSPFNKFAARILFKEYCKIFQNTFFTERIWYLGNLTLKRLILNKFVHSINIVGRLYLMSRNMDFIFVDPENLKNILVSWNLIFLMFSGLKFYSWVIISKSEQCRSLLVNGLLSNKSHCVWSL